MSTLTIRLPDETTRRLKALASARGVSLNKLMEELSTVALTAHDAETRFMAMGPGAIGMPLLKSWNASTCMMTLAQIRCKLGLCFVRPRLRSFGVAACIRKRPDCGPMPLTR